MDCSHPGFSIHGDSPGKNAGMGCHALLQGIFLTQGLNHHPLSLPHCSFFTPEPPAEPHRAGKSLWAQLSHLLPASPALTGSTSRWNLFFVQKELFLYLYYLPEFVHFTSPAIKLLNNAFFKTMFSTTFRYKIWEFWCQGQNVFLHSHLYICEYQLLEEIKIYQLNACLL